MKTRVQLLAAILLLPLAVQGGTERSALRPPPVLVSDSVLRQARDAAIEGDAQALAALRARAPELKTHVLAPYFDMWLLRAQLTSRQPDVATVFRQAQTFVEQHSKEPVGESMRVAWWLPAAQRGEFGPIGTDSLWALTPSAADEPQLRCYATAYRLQTRDAETGPFLEQSARQLLSTALKPSGDGCLSLAHALVAHQLTAPLALVHLYAGMDDLATANQLAVQLAPSVATDVKQAIDHPETWLTAHQHRLSEDQRAIAVLALIRLARIDPGLAARFSQVLHLHLTPIERGTAWGHIGWRAAVRLLPEALGWYERGGIHVGRDLVRGEEIRAWHARMAIRTAQWKIVRQVIERMPYEQARESVWTYWHARALEALGASKAANQALRTISDRLNFYGLLAREALGLAPPAGAPATVSAADLIRHEEFAPMRRIAALIRLRMSDEAQREWRWMLRAADDRQLQLLGHRARAGGSLDRMIAITERMVRTGDLTLRYPTPMREQVAVHARDQALDEALIFGVVRQESRFRTDARSPVGAQGWMQLMPRTAAYVAQRIGMDTYRPEHIFDVNVNLQLGASYLRLVREDLGGSALLAVAAYNAGPARARAWRAALEQQVDGAAFAESIPFDETREFVKQVLANTVMYGQVLDSRALSLRSLLGSVAPTPAGTTVLP